MPSIVRVRYQAQCAQNDDVMPGRIHTKPQIKIVVNKEKSLLTPRGQMGGVNMYFQAP